MSCAIAGMSPRAWPLWQRQGGLRDGRQMNGGWDQALRLWAGAGALSISAGLSFVLILLLRPVLRRHALARPNARSSHHEATPQGGGVAAITATIIAAVTVIGLIGETKFSIEILAVIAAS